MAADHLQLAAFEHENLIAAFAGIASRVPGGVVRHGDGFAALLTGFPARQFNQILVEGERPTEVGLADVIAVGRSGPSPWVLHLREGIDDDVAAMAAGLGLVRLSPEPTMPGLALADARGALLGAPPVPSGLEIVRAADDVAAGDHARVAAEAFEMPEAAVRFLLADAPWLQPDVALYTGYLDGEAVVAGLGVRSGPTIGVYNIATVEAARRRGYGEAMTRRVIADGVADGASVAILQSSALGRRVYERIGFELVVEYTGWVETAGRA
jgi:ribosomal protein S18 acetylase RimI-like enzyme